MLPLLPQTHQARHGGDQERREWALNFEATQLHQKGRVAIGNILDPKPVFDGLFEESNHAAVISAAV